jgi:RNA polymerase-binding transcription factor DksA
MAGIDDWPRAQALADSLSPERLHRALDRYAEQRCPVSNAFAHCVDSTTSSASLAPWRGCAAALAASQPSEADDSSREGDQTDHASADSQREFMTQNRERIQILLRQTERALAKLENGTYGYCEDTGEPMIWHGS